nr:MAG TPA: hypothetical protein [Caudoviricetes sp.]
MATLINNFTRSLSRPFLRALQNTFTECLL